VSDIVASAATRSAASQASQASSSAFREPVATNGSAAWSEILDGLQAEIGELHEELGDLRRRLQRIEEQLG
ncbi:MAG: hypothetical protein JXO22_00430, partial [Phycisphaerae bacterium]|nr:hypothetical protein [Phycisphaerae bacterium]